jgi:hypothetical protein
MNWWFKIKFKRVAIMIALEGEYSKKITDGYVHEYAGVWINARDWVESEKKNIPIINRIIGFPIKKQNVDSIGIYLEHPNKLFYTRSDNQYFMYDFLSSEITRIS